MPWATAPLMAFLASGRLIVMTATPPSTSVRTASDIRTSLGLEADTAVETDDFGVDVVVLDQGADEVGELRRAAHALGEDDRRDELLLELLGLLALAVDRRVDDAGADGVDADADGGQVAGGGHGHADDAALGGGVGDLAGLPF